MKNTGYLRINSSYLAIFSFWRQKATRPALKEKITEICQTFSAGDLYKWPLPEEKVWPPHSAPFCTVPPPSSEYGILHVRMTWQLDTHLVSRSWMRQGFALTHTHAHSEMSCTLTFGASGPCAWHKRKKNINYLSFDTIMLCGRENYK